VGFVVDAVRLLEPDRCSLPLPDDDTDRKRYALGLDYLITLMDAQFQDSSASVAAMFEWLRLQIATNTQTEEPDELLGRTTALTVHKAKGKEFDRVLIPRTTDTFRDDWKSEVGHVIPDSQGRPRLLWQWKPAGRLFNNRRQSDSSLFSHEAEERRREETRLLYVAMTRARHELVIFASIAAPAVGPVSANSWAELLALKGVPR
jgi:ATP-dependent exoDNAse (exonuclease V) beta subunit